MRYNMGDIIDALNEFASFVIKNATLIQLALLLEEENYAIALANEIADKEQQALDDADTLSEMRALVYGEGW